MTVLINSAHVYYIHRNRRLHRGCQLSRNKPGPQDIPGHLKATVLTIICGFLLVVLFKVKMMIKPLFLNCVLARVSNLFFLIFLYIRQLHSFNSVYE